MTNDELERKDFEKWFRPLEIKYQEQGYGAVSISLFKLKHFVSWQAGWQARAELEKSDG